MLVKSLKFYQKMIAKNKLHLDTDRLFFGNNFRKPSIISAWQKSGSNDYFSNKEILINLKADFTFILILISASNR